MSIEGENIMKIVWEILRRGNTAEIKKTKDGVIVLEVRRKIVAGK